MGALVGKNAVVTGGSSGIGLAIARAMASEGARVAVVGRRQSLVEEAAHEIGGGAIGLAGDVTKLNDLERIFAAVGERFGKLDILVCSAGSTGAGPLQTCTEEAFDALIALNVKSVFFTAQKALPYLNDQASIVIIGSVADTITLPRRRLLSKQGGSGRVRAHLGERPGAAGRAGERAIAGHYGNPIARSAAGQRCLHGSVRSADRQPHGAEAAWATGRGRERSGVPGVQRVVLYDRRGDLRRWRHGDLVGGTHEWSGVCVRRFG